MKKLIKFLEQKKVKYEKIRHRTVYTAFDKAKTLRVPEKMVGKTLVLKLDGKLGLVLVGANKNLDLKKFKKSSISKKVEFVSEKIIKNKLKGAKIGALPPFGNFWKLATFIDKALLRQPKIIVNSGDHNWSIKLKTKTLKEIIPNLVAGVFTQKK